MKNSIFPLGALALGAVTASSGSAVAADSPNKPNIVIILADDLGWGDVGYHGSKIKTPNIDGLASEGIELDRFYTAPVSSPTRAGLLTGRYPNRFGIRQTVLPPWRESGLDEKEQTIADLVGRNGYPNRAIIGKWHLGHSRMAYHPLSRGFTHFYGCLNGAIDYFTLERDGERDWHNDKKPSSDKGYSTELITKEAVECIDQYSGQDPFLLYVAYNAPHTPFQAPQQEIDRIISPEKFATLNKKQQNGYIYQAMVECMDRGIGEIIETLRKKGELDNTFLLFMSDNGGVADIPTGSTCLPLRGNKFLEWDGGVRVPAVIYWKNSPLQGSKSNQVCGYVDIAPTIAALIGETKTPDRAYDGIDITPLLSAKQNYIERDLYLGCGTVVNRDWKLILPGQNNAMNLKSEFLVKYADDPYEKVNAIEGNESIAEQLRKVIIRYDTVTPSVKELPYGFGREGFKAPKQWQITKP